MILLPYENLSLKWVHPQTLEVFAPWSTYHIEVDSTHKDFIQAVLENIYTNPQNECVQEFLTQLDATLTYPAPRTNLAKKEGKGRKEPSKYYEKLKKLSYSDSIDLQKIKQQSWMPTQKGYDGLTALCYLNFYTLLSDSIQNSKVGTLLESLQKLQESNESIFFEKIAFIARQTYLITQKLCPIASSALSSFTGKSRALVEQFIQEEKGHDRLILMSLKALGCQNPNTIAVSPEIYQILEIFQFAAEHNPLAFCAFIGFFEGTEYGESDPLVDLLKNSSRPNSMEGFRLHFEINKKENHADMMARIAAELPLQKEEDINITVRLIDAAKKLMFAYEQNILTQVQHLLQSD